MANAKEPMMMEEGTTVKPNTAPRGGEGARVLWSGKYPRGGGVRG